jgi:hypothetical protein
VLKWKGMVKGKENENEFDLLSMAGGGSVPRQLLN